MKYHLSSALIVSFVLLFVEHVKYIHDLLQGLASCTCVNERLRIRDVPRPAPN